MDHLSPLGDKRLLPGVVNHRLVGKLAGTHGHEVNIHGPKDAAKLGIEATDPERRVRVDIEPGLIVAADDFIPGNGIPVDTVQIDKAILKPGFLLLPRHAVYSGRSLTLKRVEAVAE